MKLADIDALKQTFCAECDHSIKCEDCDIDYHFEHLAPTVDAVEVVRCKDCKYAHLTYQKSCKYCDMWKDDDDFFLRLYLPPDFYCAYGERREDERK